MDPKIAERCRSAVVNLKVAKSARSYSRPWETRRSYQSGATGFLVKLGEGKEEKRGVLTCMHCVSSDATILLKRYGHAKSYPAEMLWGSGPRDIAFLEVKDPGFWEDAECLELGPDVPALQQEVYILGFPCGSDSNSICVTRGEASRICWARYFSSGNLFLLVQTSAAMNPGNSGGPVVSKTGELLGICLQGKKNLSNCADFIPCQQIRYLMEAVKGGHRESIHCAPYQFYKNLEQPALRKRLKLAENDTGVLVLEPRASGPWSGKVLAGDVLLDFEGNRIANDATVAFRPPNERVDLGYLFERPQQGQKVRLTLMRDGIKKVVEVHADMMDRTLDPNVYGKPPRYLVWGGMTFTTLTGELESTIFPASMPLSLSNRVYRVGRTSADEEVVIFLGLLPHKIHQYADSVSNVMLESVNGKRVHSMRSVVQAIVEARHKSEEFLKLELNAGNPTELTLFTKECESAHAEILSQHRVSSYASPDVARMFEEEEKKAGAPAAATASTAPSATQSVAAAPPVAPPAAQPVVLAQSQKKAKRKTEKPEAQLRTSKRAKKKN
jgi:S1-C subfamily serine protease